MRHISALQMRGHALMRWSCPSHNAPHVKSENSSIRAVDDESNLAYDKGLCRQEPNLLLSRVIPRASLTTHRRECAKRSLSRSIQPCSASPSSMDSVVKI